MTVVDLVLICAVVSLAAALAGAAFIAHRMAGDRRSQSLLLEDDPTATTFIVERAAVVETTGPARDYVAQLGEGRVSYRGLAGHLGRLFPDFSRTMLEMPRLKSATLTSQDRSSALQLRNEGSCVRLSLVSAETDVVTLDRGAHASLGAELESLRALGDAMAYAAWRQGPQGTVTWVNRAYLALVEGVSESPATAWPPHRVFPCLDPDEGDIQRLSLTDPDGGERWFDCHLSRVGADLFVTALPVDALVRAETSLSESIQAFSRTFAQLTVGIAFFDRDRKLVMFNPALTDLTTLPIDLLLSRPGLDSFLDALRSRNMMPEPKDYSSWRDHVLNVERAASDGTYCELWHLAGERTFRVTGRPQPDGAFALLVEDISAEVGLTRRFRSEIATTRAALDALPDAVAVFDEIGTLVLTNTAYDTLWGVDTESTLTQITARDALGDWMAKSEPHPCWTELRNHMLRGAEARDWTATIVTTAGTPLKLTFGSLPNAMTMVRFTPAAPPQRRARITPLRGAAEVAARLKA
ncbi:PAS-domain containing protein [Palleronia pelagia]|uniref:PAS fold n=1 Tax=Palleronia pelagia TaxID=387096 RepID=A0A1H8F7G9_9RHOB|nr:PAS-domain containing protein [Palleronia pelagia]SEN27107.1 PAS fold [Palleronia pelagia]